MLPQHLALCLAHSRHFITVCRVAVKYQQSGGHCGVSLTSVSCLPACNGNPEVGRLTQTLDPEGGFCLVKANQVFLSPLHSD